MRVSHVLSNIKRPLKQYRKVKQLLDKFWQALIEKPKVTKNVHHKEQDST